MIAHFQFPVIPNGLDDGGQELVAGRHILKEDPVLHTSTLVQKGVQAEGVQHPGANASSVHVFFVDDAIGVVPAVADNLNPEDIRDSFYMISERTRGKVTSKFIH